MEKLPLLETKDGKKAVKCSHLYKALGLAKSQYSRWVQDHIIKDMYALEGLDYFKLNVLTRQNVEIRKAVCYPHNEEMKNRPKRNRQRRTDFILTLDFAKMLAMQSRTYEGHLVRLYFLECEKKAQSITQTQNSNLAYRLNVYRKLFSIIEMRKKLNRDAKECREIIKSLETDQSPKLENQLLFNI